MIVATANLQDIGDKQLWGYFAEGICIPVFMQPYQDGAEGMKYWLVWPAVALDGPQTEYFYMTVDKYAVGRHDRYLIFELEDDMSVWFRKIEGYTPERYLTWSDKTAAATQERIAVDLNKVEFGSANEADKFLQAVIRRTRLLSLPQMRLLWNSINQVIMQWILIEKRPVTFQFGTVGPVPYRANWKSVILSKFKKSYSVVKDWRGRDPRKTTKDVLEQMQKYGLIDALFGQELLSVMGKAKTKGVARMRFGHPEHGDHTIEWNLEVVPSHTYREKMLQQEQTRMNHRGKAQYAIGIGEFIARARYFILTAFSDYVVRSSQSYGQLAPSAHGYHIIPHTRTGGIDARPAATLTEDIISSAEDPFANTRLRPIGSGEAVPMRPVSDFRPSSRHLRKAREQMEQSSQQAG